MALGVTLIIAGTIIIGTIPPSKEQVEIELEKKKQWLTFKDWHKD